MGREVAAAGTHRGDLHPVVVVVASASAVAVGVDFVVVVGVVVVVVVVAGVELQRARLAALVVALRRPCSYAQAAPPWNTKKTFRIHELG